MNRPADEGCYPLFGVVPIINTPFTADNVIDTESLGRLIDQSIEDGISGCIVPAVASEEGKLTSSERRFLVEEVVSRVGGQIPVFVGVSHDVPNESYRLAAHAMATGATGVLCRVPPGLQGDAEAVKGFFKKLEVPALMVQDLDWRGPGMKLDFIVEMFQEIPAFRCLKIETVPAGVKYTRVLEATEGRLNVSGGWALPQMIEALDRGVHAFHTTAVNKPFVHIYRRHRRGERDEAIRLFEKIVPYLAWSHQHIDISIRFLKEYCVRKGIFRTARVREPVDQPYDAYHRRCGDELIEKLLAIEDGLPGLPSIQ